MYKILKYTKLVHITVKITETLPSTIIPFASKGYNLQE